MNRRNQRLTLPIILCLVASGGLSSCSNERHTPAAAPETVGNVSVIVAQTATAPDWLEAVGTVRAAYEPGCQSDDERHGRDLCA